MELKINATSCCCDDWKLVEKYGDKLAQFGVTCNDKPIKEVEIPAEDTDERMFSRPSVKIKIDNLETLRDFIGTFGRVVMSSSNIEIYDDYRE